MKTLILGMGVQGKKRQVFCKKDFVGFVDPINKLADWTDIQQVPINSYDAVLACIPDLEKDKILKFCIQNKKHVLIEKPLFIEDKILKKYIKEIEKSNIICYVAYNHRFEPHFVRLKKLLDTNKLGKIYSCRMFYGNGTARLVRNSLWRDQGNGVLGDLGSHLIDTSKFFFNDLLSKKWVIVDKHKFENRSLDHCVIINSSKNFRIELEMTMLMWRNHFTCDILAENGTAHISSLCKWGPSKFIYRKRILPSGIPKEEQRVLVKSDPTWEIEYNYFKKLINERKKTDLNWQLKINKILSQLSED